MFEVILKGGILVPIILFLSVISLSLIIERFIFFRKIKREMDAEDSSKVVESIKNKNKSVLNENSKSPIKRVLSKVMRYENNNIEKSKLMLANSIDIEERFFSKYLQALATIGNISPILGLLGTVIGMIKAFMVIQEMGGKVNAAVLAGGIWEAMLTTALGLAVALPTIVAHSYFISQKEAYVAKIEDICTKAL